MTWPRKATNQSISHARTLAGFDVDFEVDVPPHQVTLHHTDRGFGWKGTVPNDIKHDETILWTRDYETAALPLSYAGM
jgi:hypothetical protein